MSESAELCNFELAWRCRLWQSVESGPDGMTGPENQETAPDKDPDETLPHFGGAKTARIDLGLALLSVHAKPGERFTYYEIAAWAGCSVERVRQVELAALKKARKKLKKLGITDVHLGQC